MRIKSSGSPSPTVVIRSASSSGISIANSSVHTNIESDVKNEMIKGELNSPSIAITTSTASSESRPRSLVKAAAGVTYFKQVESPNQFHLFERVRRTENKQQALVQPASHCRAIVVLTLVASTFSNDLRTSSIRALIDSWEREDAA